MQLLNICSNSMSNYVFTKFIINPFDIVLSCNKHILLNPCKYWLSGAADRSNPDDQHIPLHNLLKPLCTDGEATLRNRG